MIPIELKIQQKETNYSKTPIVPQELRRYSGNGVWRKEKKLTFETLLGFTQWASSILGRAEGEHCPAQFAEHEVTLTAVLRHTLDFPNENWMIKVMCWGRRERWEKGFRNRVYQKKGMTEFFKRKSGNGPNYRPIFILAHFGLIKDFYLYGL